MPKPRDPLVNVIAYFESAELPLAQQALTMAQTIVKGRAPKLASAVIKANKRKPTRRAESEPELPLAN